MECDALKEVLWKEVLMIMLALSNSEVVGENKRVACAIKHQQQNTKSNHARINKGNWGIRPTTRVGGTS